MQPIAVKKETQIDSPKVVGHEPKRRLRLTRVLVGLLIVWAVLDVVGRFGPVAWLDILPELVATRRPGKYYPFIPNMSLTENPWVGETAVKGNDPPRETRPPVVFSTDSLGFRLTPEVPPTKDVDLILFSGASYAYGGGLSDDQTFASVFTRKTGQRMYNGGHFWWDPMNLESLDWLLDHLKGPRSAVIMLIWENTEFQPAHLAGTNWPLARLARPLVGAERNKELAGDYEYTRRYLNAVWNISPLEVLSIRAFKKLSNGVILPNIYQEAAVDQTLPNGQDILYLPEEIDHVLKPVNESEVERNAEYFEGVAKHLAARNVQMYVIIIPNKYRLYQPWTDPSKDGKQNNYVDQLQEALERHGVNVYNTLPMLRAAAPQDVADGTLSFYREDHHWSPHGVDRVADGFAQYLSQRGGR